MTSIRHRIYIRTKKKMKFKNKRRVYEKFIGLPVLKMNMLDYGDTIKAFKGADKLITTNSKNDAIQARIELIKNLAVKVREKRDRARIRKYKASPALKLQFFKMLSPTERIKEFKFIRMDIARFRDALTKYNELTNKNIGHGAVKKEKKFQAFLPNHVWRKMSPAERKDHTVKRKQFEKEKKMRLNNKSFQIK